MKTIRVGVIGAGTMGQRHCRVYSNLRHAHLAGILDTAPRVAHQVAEQYDVPCFDDIDSLLDQIDAASLAVPTPQHFDLAMHCLERGIHVLIEKPITETVDQAERLTLAAESSGLVVQVGHIERFNPTYMELKNVLEDMSVLALNTRRLSPFKGSNTDVDVILDLMIHDIDLMRDLVGAEPLTVDAYGLTAFSGVADHVVAHLGFAMGPMLTMTASRITEQKVRCVEVTAREAFIEGNLLNKSISVHRRTTGEYENQNHRGVKYRQESLLERIHVPIFEPLFLELQHFVDCILEGTRPMVSAKDGLEALRLATTIRDSLSRSVTYHTDRPQPVHSAHVEPAVVPALG
jgi:predicted dehydrogenase